MDDYEHSAGAAYDSWCWVRITEEVLVSLEVNFTQILLFRTCEEKICTFATMAECHGYRCHLVPVVLLGLLIGFLAYSRKVHW